MPDIIPFDIWINSQLSIARHYGSIQIDNKTYIVDYIFCKGDENALCKPDLVEEKLYNQMQKDRKKEVKAYYDEAKRREKEKYNSLPF